MKPKYILLSLNHNITGTLASHNLPTEEAEWGCILIDRLACRVDEEEKAMPPKTSSKFLQGPAAHSPVSHMSRSQSEAASGGSRSADVPPTLCPCKVLQTLQV